MSRCLECGKVWFTYGKPYKEICEECESSKNLSHMNYELIEQQYFD